jgi:hypothetical protein
MEEYLADCPEGTNCYIKNEDWHVWYSIVYICASFLSCQGLNFTSDTGDLFWKTQVLPPVIISSNR